MDCSELTLPNYSLKNDSWHCRLGKLVLVFGLGIKFIMAFIVYKKPYLRGDCIVSNFITQNNAEGAISIGISALAAGYCYSFGWSALSSLGLIMTAGVGAFTLFKLAELCISLKKLVDNCNGTVTQVNKEIVIKLAESIQKINNLSDKVESTLDLISNGMLPEAQQTLTNVQDMTREAKAAVDLTSSKVDEMLSGQMVLQLGTASVLVNSQKIDSDKSVKPH